MKTISYQEYSDAMDEIIKKNKGINEILEEMLNFASNVKIKEEDERKKKKSLE